MKTHSTIISFTFNKHFFCVWLYAIKKTDCTKKSGKMSIPREQPNQNKETKNADSVLFSLYIRDN